MVERLTTITRKTVINIQDVSAFNIDFGNITRGMKLKDAVSAFEKNYISEVLDNVGGNRRKAAQTLGIHRNTLFVKMNEPADITGEI